LSKKLAHRARYYIGNRAFKEYFKEQDPTQD